MVGAIAGFWDGELVVDEPDAADGDVVEFLVGDWVEFAETGEAVVGVDA